MLGERGAMRVLPFAALLLLAPAAAHADPVQEARSATGACLAAILDDAPVSDIDGDDVQIRRGQDPVSCTVRVSAGEPVLIKDAVQQAMKRRLEIFAPARTAWEPGDWASRETWCNLPGRRAVAVFVTTAKPGRQPVLTATVFESKARDQRCDRDLGVQRVAANEAPAPEPAAETSAPVAAAPASTTPPVAEVAAPAPKKKKESLLRKIPGLGRDK